jgi:ribonuclease Y
VNALTVVILIAALGAVVTGIGIVVYSRRARSVSAVATNRRPLSVADANAQASDLVAEARSAALAAREAAIEEVNIRRAAVESRDALLAERHRHLRERRQVFDERRFAYKKRREEIEARRAEVAASHDEVASTVLRIAALGREQANAMVLERLDIELATEYAERVERAVSSRIGEDPAVAATNRIIQAIERQDASNVDSAPRVAPVPLESLDAHARERVLTALAVIAEDTGAELGVDAEKEHATLRTVDPIGREIARQASLEVLDRKVQAADVPPLLLRTRRATHRRVIDLGERALWQMQMAGRPELAELMGTLHYRFSYGQNALLHCQETGYLCGVLAAELGLEQSPAREAGALHDVGKAVDHEVEGVHAIIGGELLRVLGVDAGIVHAVKAHHFDEEPATDLAMLTICADAISASRPGARRDTLAAYLARLEQLQTIATRHSGVERAFPLQAGREVRVFVKAAEVDDGQMPSLSAEIAREIESEMQYPGMIKVTVIRETTATATAPAQIAPVRAGNGARASHDETTSADSSAGSDATVDAES